MTRRYADARPTRRFFIDMLTADIALEDAILDLVDNAIDALSRAHEIDLSDRLLFSPNAARDPLPRISVHISDREVRVEDNCGGIEKTQVVENVFRIGRVVATTESSIGVYGIGLKRAIFKIGNSFELKSKTLKSGFVASLSDIATWADDDSPDWKLPVEDASAARSQKLAGTTVRIWNLHDPIKRRINEGTLLVSLRNTISRTYPLFLQRFVSVTLNGTIVRPEPLPIGGSESIAPAMDSLNIDDPPVRVTVLAGVASTDNEEWSGANAGWYIICNGRVVVSADKSELTGWGTKLLPQFHSKYRAFIGIAFFFSVEPASLPWTTTKRSINRDSVAYQRAQPRMATVARQVLVFMNRWYPSEMKEAPAEREVAASVRRQDVSEIATRGASEFKAVVKKKRSVADMVKVQFDVTNRELEKARRCIGKPSWSGVKIGRYAFDYLLRNECGNE